MITDIFYEIIFGIPKLLTLLTAKISESYMPDITWMTSWAKSLVYWAYGILHYTDGWFDAHNIVWGYNMIYKNLWLMVSVMILYVIYKRIMSLVRPGADI